MRVESVAESFATYRQLLVNAPQIQVDECRRAFYAGAYFLLMNVAYNIGDDEMPEEQGIVELEKLKHEIEAFAESGGMPLPVAEPPPPLEPPAPPPTDHHYAGPDAAEVRDLLNDLGGRLREAMLPGWGYVLLIASFGEQGGLFYISNIEREDVFKMMREYMNRQTQ